MLTPDDPDFPSAPAPPPVLGIFVGGEGKRMGHVVKGLLPTRTGRPIVQTLAERFRSVAPAGHVVLLGGQPEFEALTYQRLPDAPPGVGPMGGLHALLLSYSNASRVLTVAGDMPHVSVPMFQSLLTHPLKSALAYARGAELEPLCAAYRPTDALQFVERALAQSQHSVRRLLVAMNAARITLPAGEAHALQDWDTPEDIRRFPA